MVSLKAVVTFIASSGRKVVGSLKTRITTIARWRASTWKRALMKRKTKITRVMT